MGKALAAYERLLLPGWSRFDEYVDALLVQDREGLSVLTADEIAGLKLFLGKAGCVKCHAGPLFSTV